MAYDLSYALAAASVKLAVPLRLGAMGTTIFLFILKALQRRVRAQVEPHSAGRTLSRLHVMAKGRLPVSWTNLRGLLVELRFSRLL